MALNNVPLPGQTLNNSRNPINQNFVTIDNIFSVNHVDYGAVDAGKHKWVALPVQAAAPPGGAFAAAEVGLYSFLNPVTNHNELYVNKTNQVTVTQIPATASRLSVTSNPTAGTGMWTYLPSGIIIKSGTTAVNAGATTITIAGAPAFAAILSVMVAPYYAGVVPGGPNEIRIVGLVDIAAAPANDFTVYMTNTLGNPAAGQITYIAIGY